MKPILFALVLAPLFAASPVASPKPIAVLDWLVGGVWIADASAFGGGMQRIETRYRWADNEAFLRFTTHFVSDRGTARTYDGNLFWNPAQKQLWMWYADAGGQLLEGPMKVDGDLWSMTFRGLNREGKMADLRADITRKSKDLYHWALSEKQGTEWKEAFSLDYRRAAEKGL